MDSRLNNNNSSGSLQSFGIVGAAVLFLCVSVAPPSRADQPPSLQPGGHAKTVLQLDASHSGVFPEQNWKLHASHPFGATVAVWTIEPFRNVNDHTSLVDAQLNLRVIGHSPWQTFVPHDRTDFQRGRSAAHVVAASPGGSGECGITVSFLGQELPLVSAGDYETTVVGTITEAF